MFHPLQNKSRKDPITKKALCRKEYKRSQHPKDANREPENEAMSVATLALIVVGQPRLSEYLVEEALTVLLGVAALVLPMLLTVITFILVWQGASLAFRRLRAGTERITSLRDRRSRPGPTTRHPLPGD